VEPGRIDEEDDAGDQDLARPTGDEEERRKHDSPESELRQTHRGCEVEHVPREPVDERPDQDHCDERRDRNRDPACDERTEPEDA
jgi:hypothetical protein